MDAQRYDELIRDMEDKLTELKEYRELVRAGVDAGDVSKTQAVPGRMTIDDTFFKFIKEREGLRLETYLDTGGVLTIGYGHTGPDVKAGMAITEQRANELLLRDVQWAIDAVNDMVKVPLKQNQFNALVSFVFNIGTGAFAKSTLLRLLNTGAYMEVPTQLRRWIYDQRGQPVLVSRREEEVKLWNTPSSVAMGV